MQRNQKEIKSIDTGNECLESYPCQHSVTLFYKNGTEEHKGRMSGDDIAQNYYNYLSESDQKHFAEYLTKEYLKNKEDLKNLVSSYSFLSQKNEEESQSPDEIHLAAHRKNY